MLDPRSWYAHATEGLYLSRAVELAWGETPKPFFVQELPVESTHGKAEEALRRVRAWKARKEAGASSKHEGRQNGVGEVEDEGVLTQPVRRRKWQRRSKRSKT